MHSIPLGKCNRYAPSVPSPRFVALSLALCATPLTACAATPSSATVRSPLYVDGGTASVSTFQWSRTASGQIDGTTESYVEQPGGRPEQQEVGHFTGMQHGDLVTFEFHPTSSRTVSLDATVTPTGLQVHFPAMGGCKSIDTGFYAIGTIAAVNADVARMTGASECS
jgi:hypothetical protein